MGCQALPSGSIQKREISPGLTKKLEKQDNDDPTCQGPCNGVLGCWSHDQLPKMVKNESCSPVL